MFERVPDSVFAEFALSALVLLALASILGEFAKSKLGLIPMVGHIMAGVLLGPSILPKIAPDLAAHLFPAETARFLGFGATASLALFMFVGGYELGLAKIRQSFAGAKWIFAGAFATPLITTTAIVYAAAPWAITTMPGVGSLETAIVIGCIASITAVPILIGVLQGADMSHKLFYTPVVIAAALCDILGSLLAAMSISVGSPGEAHAAGTHDPSIFETMIGFGILIVSVPIMTKVVNLLFIKMDSHSCTKNSKVLLPILFAAFGFWWAETIGVHGVFGAFGAGIAVGDADEEFFTPHFREVHEQFVGSIFTPFFLATIGLRADFVASFDLLTVSFIWIVMTGPKMWGGFKGAKYAGYYPSTSAGIGATMASNGALMIVFASLAEAQQVISAEIMTAIVVNAIISSTVAAIGLRVYIKPNENPTISAK